ncbi:MAG: heavy metal translocating P-type ATPase, partial [Pseudorhizobium sp.]
DHLLPAGEKGGAGHAAPPHPSGRGAPSAAEAGEGADPDAHDHASHTHTHHDTRLKRDLIIAFVLTLPLFVLEMGSHADEPMHHWLMGAVETQTLHYAYFVLATVVIFWPGLRF